MMKRKRWKVKNPLMILRALYRCGYLPKPGEEDIQEVDLVWEYQNAIIAAQG